jgi:iron complex outermembrane receptor protein
MKSFTLLYLLFSFLSAIAFGQNKLTGTVTDARTHEPLAGVAVCDADDTSKSLAIPTQKANSL